MVSVDTLDISAVTLVGDDTPYKQLLTERSDIGFGTTTEIYYLSENDTVIYDGEATGMGGYVGVHHVFCKDLSGAFAECESFKRIIMPNCLTKIGNFQFFKNSVLESIELPANASSLGTRAFDGTSRLQSLRIPDGIVSIPERSVRCASLNEVYLPASVDTIHAQAFEGSPIETINLDKVRYIGKYSFYQNRFSGILNISSSEYIGSYAFYTNDGNNVENILFSEFIRNIPDHAFSGFGITELDLPANIERIGDYSFGNCNDLISVILPSNLKSIATTSFSNTPWQNNLIGENGVIYAGPIALGYDYKTAPGNDAFSFKEGTTIIADQSGYGFFPTYQSGWQLNSVNLPSSLVRIGDKVFYNCRDLTSISLPDGLQEIGKGSFASCTSLSVINLPSKLQEIPAETFYECENLGDIEFPSSLKKIGERAFSGARKLYFSEFPSSLRVIEGGAFQGCKSLPSITLTENIDSIYGGAFENCDGMEYLLMNSKKLHLSGSLFKRDNDFSNKKSYNQSLYQIKVGREVTVLPDVMFMRCTGLEKVEFEDIDSSELKKIGYDCFRECPKLKISELPESLDTIGSGAFFRTMGYSGHLDLKNISYVGDGAFEGEYGESTGLTGLTVSAPNVYLGRASFAFNPQLKDISILSETLESDGSVYSPFLDASYYYTNAEFDNVEIGSDLNGIPAGFFQNCQIGNLKFETREESGHGLEIGRYAFLTSRIPGPLKLPIGTSALREECFKLNDFTDISVPGSCKEIGDEVFINNFELTSITLEEGLESMGDYVFTNCSSLKSLTIPSSCGEIGVGIIGGCTSLESVTFLPEIPPLIKVSGDIKNLGVRSNPTIYVPFESYYLYLEVPALQGYRIEAMKPETILVESVTLTPDVWNGVEGDSFKIEAMVLPENASDQTLLWTTSDDSVATVDQEGNVDVISEGNCVITATAVDSMLISAQCIVTSVAGIDIIFNDDDYFDVYDLNGRLLLKHISKAGLQKLSPSVYLLRRENLNQKIIIR